MLSITNFFFLFAVIFPFGSWRVSISVSIYILYNCNFEAIEASWHQTKCSFIPLSLSLKTCVDTKLLRSILFYWNSFSANTQKTLFRRHHRLCNDSQAKEFNPFAKRKTAGWLAGKEFCCRWHHAKQIFFFCSFAFALVRFHDMKPTPSNCWLRESTKPFQNFNCFTLFVENSLSRAAMNKSKRWEKFSFVHIFIRM